MGLAGHLDALVNAVDSQPALSVGRQVAFLDDKVGNRHAGYAPN